MSLRILNRLDVEQCLSHAECIDVLVDTMKSVSNGEADMPLRRYLSIPASNGGKMALMPGYLANPRCFGVKLVSKFPRTPNSPLGSHVGAVMIFDADEGTPLALLDGGTLTAIRTAAASALATRELANPDANRLVVLGCGEQALHHIRALTVVRDFAEIVVWGRSADRCATFVSALSSSTSVSVRAEQDIEAAVRTADVLCAVTSAREPIFSGAWLTDGAHVNLVGAAVRTAKETDAETVTRSRFFVDYRTSALDQAGELMDLVDSGRSPDELIAGEIGDVLSGAVEGRENPDQITVYKSLGVAAQDLSAGLYALQAAERRGAGVSVEW